MSCVVISQPNVKSQSSQRGIEDVKETRRDSVPADIYFLPWKSSVHKFISTIWQAVNGHNLAGMSYPPLPFRWVSKKIKKNGGFFVYGMIRDNKW